ncbi:hypothetical protein LJ737_21710 [Hymenobacter sp. 15J16-1T3B]|uniref:hypothetical protein n=1 Tax=Hymenobacter sp. 15J16-1T3B TaxID=2886941 RepID=UPI001D0FC41F|nr:hypothetical protein [Hymenobacter sp. 15J16-1T3B]MCC3159873.1 hypothetical protein [Hymenobacter sp. 15J16-1T3B]
MRFFSSLALLLALRCGPAPAALAQQPTSAAQPLPALLEPVPLPGPVYIINERYVVGDNGLRAISPQSIRRVVVYKNGSAPAKWRSLAYYGILSITLTTKVRPDSKSQAQLRRWLKLSGPVRFQVDGQLLEDDSLRVATAAIATLEIRRGATAADETIVNIRLVRLPPPPVPPGQIRIRGLAHLAP